MGLGMFGSLHGPGGHGQGSLGAWGTSTYPPGHVSPLGGAACSAAMAAGAQILPTGTLPPPGVGMIHNLYQRGNPGCLHDPLTAVTDQHNQQFFAAAQGKAAECSSPRITTLSSSRCPLPAY